MAKHRHSWRQIASGYAKECRKCGKRVYGGRKVGKEYFGEGTSRGSRFR